MWNSGNVNTGFGSTTDSGAANSGFNNTGTGESGFDNSAVGGGDFVGNISGFFNNASGGQPSEGTGGISGIGNTGVPGVLFGPFVSGQDSGFFNTGSGVAGFFSLAQLLAG